MTASPATDPAPPLRGRRAGVAGGLAKTRRLAQDGRPEAKGTGMEIHKMPGHLIRRLNQISTALFMERMAQAGLTLTPVQFAALSAIRTRPGIDQATVAGLVAYDRATLGKVIDKLDARGLVSRRVSTQDRRARELAVTEAGEALYHAALPHVLAMQPEMLGGLDAQERKTFLALLDKATMAANDRSRAPLKTPRD